MKAKLSHIQSGIAKWYAKHVAPMGWSTTLAMPLFNMAVTGLMQKNKNLLDLILDENNEIDIDVLYKEYSQMLNKQGVVTFYKINFNVQDLDMLYNAIKAEIPLVEKES